MWLLSYTVGPQLYQWIVFPFMGWKSSFWRVKELFNCSEGAIPISATKSRVYRMVRQKSFRLKQFLNFWVLHSPNSIFHGCTYSFVLNFDLLIEVEFEPPGTDSRAEVILEQSFWSKERRSWLWIQMRIWRYGFVKTWDLKSSSPAQKK